MTKPQKRANALRAFSDTLSVIVILLVGGVTVGHAQGSVWAWGDNSLGELGNGTFTGAGPAPGVATPGSVLGPGGVGFLYGITGIAGGEFFSLALKSDGTVWAWGQNNVGQLGNGTFNSAGVAPGGVDYTGVATPGQVVGPLGAGLLTGVVAIAAGFDHSVALRSDGTVWAWGYNTCGHLGDGTFTGAPNYGIATRGQAVGLSGIVAIAAGGGDCSLALGSDGTVWAWGDNSRGQLGNGTFTGVTNGGIATPGQVVGFGGAGLLTGVGAIATDGDISMALKNDGTVWTWGVNSEGLLGYGTFTGGDQPTPGQVVGPPGGTGFLTGVAAIAASGLCNLALKSDGTVWAWGNNGYGELGNGAFVPNEVATPGQVVGTGGTGFLTGAVAIAESAGAFNLAIVGRVPVHLVPPPGLHGPTNVLQLPGIPGGAKTTPEP